MSLIPTSWLSEIVSISQVTVMFEVSIAGTLGRGCALQLLVSAVTAGIFLWTSNVVVYFFISELIILHWSIKQNSVSSWYHCDTCFHLRLHFRYRFKPLLPVSESDGETINVFTDANIKLIGNLFMSFVKRGKSHLLKYWTWSSWV